jgi:hypothetical protein
MVRELGRGEKAEGEERVVVERKAGRCVCSVAWWEE